MIYTQTGHRGPTPLRVILLVSGLGFQTGVFATDSSDPQEMLGYALSATHSDFAIYSTNRSAEVELARWVEAQLVEFRSLFDPDYNKRGIVFVLDGEVAPTPQLESWRAKHVSRKRSISWKSPIRRQTVKSDAGRPYCLSKTPYFSEAWWLPPKVLGRVAGVSLNDVGWVVFLVSDTHFARSFDAENGRNAKANEEHLKSVPPVVRFLSVGTEQVMRLVHIAMLADYKKIDRRLMHLQRKEVLWEAFLASGSDQNQFSTGRATLQGIVDDIWKFIWFRRPLD